jgi:two-component system, response regulator
MEQVDEVDILLVEDNPMDAELTMHGLQAEKLANRITWLKDGEEALNYLFRRGEFAERADTHPRLVILDLKMPRVDGIEVLREMKANEATKRIPVVMLTSSQEESDLIRSYNLGVNSYVVKPLNFKSMTDVIRQAGYFWLAVNRTAPY